MYREWLDKYREQWARPRQRCPHAAQEPHLPRARWRTGSGGRLGDGGIESEGICRMTAAVESFARHDDHRPVRVVDEVSGDAAQDVLAEEAASAFPYDDRLRVFAVGDVDESSNWCRF
jgi:hypothetical protein